MTSPLTPVGAPADNDAKALRKAAQGFEALMLEKLIAAARPEDGGPMGDARSLAEQSLAADLARSNLFGLAQLLEKKP